MKFTKMFAIGLGCAALAACGGDNAEENIATDANLVTEMDDMNMGDMNMTDLNATDMNMTDLNATDANMTDLNSVNTL